MTHNQVDTEAAARKRQEIGLSPRRATAQGVVARPPDTRSLAWLHPWLWVALVAIVALFTLALVVARVVSENAAAGARGQPSLFTRADVAAAAPFRYDFEAEEGPLVRDFQPRKWSMGVPDGEGVYRIRLSPSVIAWSTLGAGDLEGFRFAARMQVSGETPWGYGGLMGRYADDRNLYLVEVDGEARYRFQVQSGGEWTTLQDWTPSDLLKPAGEWNEVTLVDSGGSVAVEANGKELFRTQAVWLPPGDAGVVAGSLQPAVAEANFDWITLDRVP